MHNSVGAYLLTAMVIAIVMNIIIRKPFNSKSLIDWTVLFMSGLVIFLSVLQIILIFFGIV